MSGVSSDIQLEVLPDMRLFVHPQEIARDAEHNAGTFRISQPPALDAYACRAEIQTSKGMTYRLVTDHSFPLTNDVAVAGTNRIQLVYSNGTDTTLKTSVAAYHVSASLNALDPSAPGFADGLAQLQGAAFTKAEVTGNTLAFRNLGGSQIDQVTLPGLDTAALDASYLRRNGTNQMDASVTIIGANRGVVFDALVSGAAVYNTGTNLVLRRPAGNADVLVENNNGDAGTRSPVMTQAAADARYDARYLQQGSADARYVQQSGGFLTGPLRQLGNPAPAFDDTLVTRGYVDARPSGITEAEGDARYLQQSGGGMSGMLFMQANQPFVSAMGTGSNPMLCIGTNDSGYWRSGGSVIYEVGRTANRIDSATSTAFQVPVTMPGATLSGNLGITGTANAIIFGTQGRIYSPAAGIVIRRGFGQGHLITEANNGDVATRKQLVDEDDLAAVARAPSVSLTMLADVVLTADPQNIFSQAYPIARGGNSRVKVTIRGGLRAGGPTQITIVQVRCGGFEQNIFAYSVAEAPGFQASGVMLVFVVDVTGAAPVLSADIRLVGSTAAVNLIGGSGDAQRTVVVLEDAGPR